MATTLVNMEKRRQLIELSHQTFYRPRWGYRVTLVKTSEHNPRTGSMGYREVKKKLPGTLTLLGGKSLKGLPDDIAAVPAVRAAVKAGKIRIVREGDASAKPAARAATHDAPASEPEPKHKNESKARNRRGT